MIKTIIKIGLLLVAGVLFYNYFFGTEVEKAQSREFVGKARDLGKDAWDLLRSERQKMKDGKYDGALDELDALYTDLRERGRALKDSGVLERLRDLEQRRRAIEDELATDATAEPAADTKRKIEDLTVETEALMNEMEAKSQPVPR